MSKYLLSKDVLDIGYFTDHLDETLRFWKNELGSDCETPVRYNDGLTQYRYPLRETIIKVNTSDRKLAKPPSGYTELFIATKGINSPKSLHNPDGELVTLVPKGYLGISETAIKVSVSNIKSHEHFYEIVMGFEKIGENSFRSGNCLLFTEKKEQQGRAGHWVNFGFRYFTVHVRNIDDTFNRMVAAGAEVGEEPYAIGDIAKISFVRDPDGNWIEVAQRASLAGPWT